MNFLYILYIYIYIYRDIENSFPKGTNNAIKFVVTLFKRKI